MSSNWIKLLNDQERKLAVATLFLNNLVEGDIQVPDEATELAGTALKDLNHHGAVLSTIRRKLEGEADHDAVMENPALQKAYTEISTATDKVLGIQDQLISAHDQGAMNIVSREEMESIKGSPLVM
jgi:hypothetical protein